MEQIARAQRITVGRNMQMVQGPTGFHIGQATEPPFLARLVLFPDNNDTGRPYVAGRWLYSFVEQALDPATGQPMDKPGGRRDNIYNPDGSTGAGTVYALEANNVLVGGASATFTPLLAPTNFATSSSSGGGEALNLCVTAATGIGESAPSNVLSISPTFPFTLTWTDPNGLTQTGGAITNVYNLYQLNGTITNGLLPLNVDAYRIASVPAGTTTYTFSTLPLTANTFALTTAPTWNRSAIYVWMWPVQQASGATLYYFYAPARLDNRVYSYTTQPTGPFNLDVSGTAGWQDTGTNLFLPEGDYLLLASVTGYIQLASVSGTPSASQILTQFAVTPSQTAAINGTILFQAGPIQVLQTDVLQTNPSSNATTSSKTGHATIYAMVRSYSLFSVSVMAKLLVGSPAVSAASITIQSEDGANISEIAAFPLGRGPSYGNSGVISGGSGGTGGYTGTIGG